MRKKATHQPLPANSYTFASEVRITKEDPTLQELREGSCQRWEEPLTKEEQAKVLARDWQVILPGGAKGAEVIRADRKPTSWGMSATRMEREEAHRRRIEELQSAQRVAGQPAQESEEQRKESPFFPKRLKGAMTEIERRKAREPII